MTFAIIKAHPLSQTVVLVDMPSATAQAIQNQPTTPAMFWDRDRRSWRVRTDELALLQAIFTYLQIAATDERHDGPIVGPARPLPECCECGTPARRADSTKLARCPGCGKPWQPIEITSAQ